MTQPVCIECGTRVPQVMREFSRGVIQLAKCVGDFLVFSGSNSVQENPSCLQLVDSYVECDSTIIFIDLVLLKRQAYRHLLFNSSKYSRGMSSVPAILNVVYLSHFLSAQGPIIKLAVLRVFMDIYYRWFRVKFQKGSANGWPTIEEAERDFENDTVLLCFTLFDFFAKNIAIILMILVVAKMSRVRQFPLSTVFSALILSSFGKFLCALCLIWEYEAQFEWVLQGFVLCSNVVAIQAALNWEVLRATACVGLGATVHFGLVRAVASYVPVTLEI